jgi:hypothetical protein
VIRDQRRMLLGNPAATPRDVEQEWLRYTLSAAFRGFPNRDYAYTWVEDPATELVAYVSDERWVADCPHCNGGIALWPGTTHGGACYDCGTVFRQVDYPDEETIVAVEEVFDVRPKYARHWLRNRGETLAHLQAENIAFGVEEA